MSQPPDSPWRRPDEPERSDPVQRPRHRDAAGGTAPLPTRGVPADPPARPEAAPPPPPQPSWGAPTVESRGMSTEPRSTDRPAATVAAPRPRRPVSRRPPRRHAVLRKVDPWSVLKLSLIFYFCVLLVVMLAMTVFWGVVNRIGIVDRILDFLADLQLIVTIDGGMIARAVFLIGLLNVILWSGINVFLAFLYNLIADLVGGLRVTVVDEE
jgi:hypothetical protein